MVRPSKEEIQAAIRDGVVRVVAEKGISAVSVNDVAKQAKVSPGTIYLHFKNKEDMLQLVYLNIKTEFHKVIMASQSEQTSKAMIRRIWFDMFKFVEDHPYDFQFIENAGAAQILTNEQSAVIADMEKDITNMLQGAIDDNTLAELPVSTVIVLLVAPALHMARLSLRTNQPILADDISLTFERVWLSICNTAT